MSEEKITVGVLLYGEHTDLARRCLGSIVERLTPDQIELRVGLNAVCPSTLEFVLELVGDGHLQEDMIYESTENIHKYPMMRRMLYDPDHPMVTPYFMWFDDDSYLIGNYNQWNRVVCDAMADADLIGGVYTINLGGNQHEWVKRQSWFAGKPIAAGQQVSFVTGGWWTVRVGLFEQHDWPTSELDHRGGDVMLGELCRQQGYRMKAFRHGVAINANSHGLESRAPRRGFDQKPVGWDFDPGVAAALHAATNVPVKPRRLELDL